MDIGPGDFVECVNNRDLNGHWEDSERPVVGAIYTVQRVLMDDDNDPILHLKEIRRCAEAVRLWGPDVGYWALRFRPIYRPKPDVFADLLKAPGRVGEPA